MAINRTNFNLLVDDDGSNLVGTIWDKAHIKDVILDPVDAALIDPASNAPYTVILTTQTGVAHNWNPGVSGHTFIVWNGSADLTITGITGGINGQLLTIKNTQGGPSNIYLSHYNASSSAAARLANMAVSGSTPIAASGAATYYYDGNLGYWNLIAHEQGAWITPPFNAANFSGSDAAWTVDAGDVQTFKYQLNGRGLAVSLSLNATSVGGLNGALNVTIPLGMTSKMALNVPAMLYNNSGSVAEFGYLLCDVNSAALGFRRLSPNLWAASTNLTYAYGQITFEVN